MRKILFLVLVIFTLMLCLAGCNSLRHEHITDEWECNEAGHWQPITCNLNTCDLEEMPILDHIDDKNDNICDVCGYAQNTDTNLPTDSNTQCVHTYGEWQYDDTYHWRNWSCNLDLCDIETTGEHIDKDHDVICDECGYAR